MKKIISVLGILLILSAVTYADELLELSEQAFAQKINETILCGNDVCQPGEELTCPQDCDVDLAEGPRILYYIVIAGFLYMLYKKKR